ncbi:MAG: phospholipid carrier-dependent glycosyltransferase [Proteobacteria bacterium]|nr:phospholipid carrier-dependent glycosyltransferase [Pseudomonadota bacterium]
MRGALHPVWPDAFRLTGYQPGVRLRTGLACFAVMAVAAFLLFFRLGEVRAPIWDEAYYLTAAARIHEGRVQFASHPPLGLMLIAAGDTASGLNRDFDWRGIASVKSVKAEQVPASFDYRGPRLASALFGTLAAGLFFLLMLELSGSLSLGLILSTLFLCDPALIAQFRAAHLDAFQIAFVLGGLLCGLRALKTPGSLIWTAGFAAAIAAAAMVRVNALALGTMGLVLLWPCLRSGDWRQALRQSLAAAVSALVVVSASFALMLGMAKSMPDDFSAAGRIDRAHVSADYLAVDATTGLRAYITDYTGYMAADMTGLGKTDANASHPWQWLVGSGAITYRWDANDQSVSAIGLIPNRAAWLLSLAGVVLTLIALRKRPEPVRVVLVIGWLVSMAALVWLDGQRMMYAYHYFIPLLLGYAMLARTLRKQRISEGALWGSLTAVTAFAALSLPLALNQRVSRTQCHLFLKDCGKPAPPLSLRTALLHNKAMDSLEESDVIDGRDAQADTFEVSHDHWPEYNAALKNRGSLDVWFDPQMDRFSLPSGRPSHPLRFSDSAIVAMQNMGKSLQNTFNTASNKLDCAKITSCQAQSQSDRFENEGRQRNLPPLFARRDRHSAWSYHDGCEMDKAGEVDGASVVAGSEAPEMLDAVTPTPAQPEPVEGRAPTLPENHKGRHAGWRGGLWFGKCCPGIVPRAAGLRRARR